MIVSTIALGTPAPDFDLPGVDGKRHSLASFAGKNALVVVFTCNHCPYSRDYEDRIISVQRDYADRGVQVVAINSNDAEAYPQDSFEEMITRAEQKGFNFPYLRDESQEVVGAYGGVCTPHVFAFDSNRTLRYRGRVDDSRDASKIKSHDLRNALDDLLKGTDVRVPDTRPFGCSIKWSSAKME
jgi:peroxiredoxin